MGSNSVVVRGTDVKKSFFTPFGEITQPLGGLSEYLFTDQEHDPESGLMYYGARYYDPWVGRFLSQDPGLIGFTPGATFERLYGGSGGGGTLGSVGDVDPRNYNAYAYALNSPTGFTDPTGGEPISLTIAAVGGCAASVGCVVATGVVAGLVVANVVAVIELVKETISNNTNQQSSTGDAGQAGGKKGDAGPAATGSSNASESGAKGAANGPKSGENAAEDGDQAGFEKSNVKPKQTDGQKTIERQRKQDARKRDGTGKDAGDKVDNVRKFSKD